MLEHSIDEFRHDHDHDHDHSGSTGHLEARTRWVVVITAAMMVGELVVGTLTNSMALTADGWHMATHAGALGLSTTAYWFARTRARESSFTFGTWKVYALAGYTSAVILGLVAVLMLVESCRRLAHPLPIHFKEALPVAILGLLVNLASVKLLDADDHGGHHDDHGGHGGDGGHGGQDHNLRAAYFHVLADLTTNASRDGMNVYNARLYTSPLRRLPGLGFEFEYAREDNGDLIKSTAFTGLASYELGSMGWKPKLSYRYAWFQGDDPATAANEGFDMLLPGFYDWGTWWQGEIAGEYFLSNSNLVSHQVRLHLTPSDALSGGLIGYSFLLDQPASFGSGVTSKNLAMELDAYADWKLNSNFTVSLVAAFANPQDAASQGYGRTSNFSYGMLYVAYAF